MGEKRVAAKQGGWRAALAAALVAGVIGMLASALAFAQANDGFQIQVFALSGPACGGPVILGEDCPDVLLPGAELVLEKWEGKRRGWKPVTRFNTNRSGYADLVVKQRGRYRVEAPEDDAVGIRPAPLPFFEGPVQFRVPARHLTAQGVQLTPVVVQFDSGIR